MNRPVIRIAPQKNIRPVYISNTPDVSRGYVQAAIDAVYRIAEIAGAELPIKCFGSFRISDAPYGNADWYVQQAWNPQRRQLDASKMLLLSMSEPYQRAEPHYEVWITGMDLWSGRDDNRFVFGLTQPAFGTIQSYRRIEDWYGRSEIPANQLFEDMVKHEVAHMFRAPKSGRQHTEQNIGTHCTNDPCMMGQVNVTGRPTLLESARLRRRTGVEFCGECTEDIRDYFR